ncbi:PDZ domain-containing protein [Clostridium algidicarnis]|uniref:PDZ domain-containing protein n=1 Tax=Clostridium algidicarnis TaxID=37659 RepID=UPI001C0C3DC8|nr:PDZ domain-containing protein [Clostridium algidicarnis]MBU3205034.1 hypothetical protein [Clostridium algidicarnis]MBU3213188.1 hypothetical protein [Clostridium algidicarnis]MBU3223243.1 hypothetical protein [Clostridium algidicarnis]MBU3228059.1 hypothetical protein [Clostridium algidicarnis]MBU3251772.1 hypothetical protein [Clostridium algidicarnis]
MGIAGYTLKAVAFAMVSPQFAITLIMLAFIFYGKNKRTVLMQKMILGEQVNSPLELTMSQLVLGIIGGVMSSLILSYLGVMFGENSGIHLMFVFSLLLLFFSPRFICFSYSGALLGLLSIILNLIKDPLLTMYPTIEIINRPFYIDIAALMTLVGVLHIVEGLLVSVDGHRGAIPIFTNRDGKILGGFALKRYWAMPIAILMILSNETGTIGQNIITPSWWPIMRNPLTLSILTMAVVSIMPFYGVLGYNSITFTRSKGEKSAMSGIGILIYGITLTLVAQLARISLSLQLFVILFAPLAHEIMLNTQKIIESKTVPKFISDEEGLMVLDVAPQSIAYNAGIRSGDKLLEINNSKIENESYFYKTLNEGIEEVKFKLKDSKGNIKQLVLNKGKRNKIGLVIVPRAIVSEDQSEDNTKDEDTTNKSKNEYTENKDKEFKDILEDIKKHEDKDGNGD